MNHTLIKFGDGRIGVDRGGFEKSSEHHEYTFVAFFPLGKNEKVGSKIPDDKNASNSEVATWLMFKNVESIEVVEEALAIAKKLLIEKGQS